MAPPAFLIHLFEPWAHIYSDSKVIPTLVTFGHIAALVFAGGYAITLDRATLRAVRGEADVRTRHLDELSLSHRIVLTGLVISFVTGAMLFTADIETFWKSWIWWTKAGLIVLLLANGYGITRAEKMVRAGSDGGVAGWAALQRTAWASLVFWFSIAFAGVALVNAG